MANSLTLIQLRKDINSFIVGYPDLRRYWLGKRGEFGLIPLANAQTLEQRKLARIFETRNARLPFSVNYLNAYLS